MASRFDLLPVLLLALQKFLIASLVVKCMRVFFRLAGLRRCLVRLVGNAVLASFHAWGLMVVTVMEGWQSLPLPRPVPIRPSCWLVRLAVPFFS